MLNPVSDQKSSVEKRFGVHLRTLRTDMGITQRELAQRMTVRGFSWLQSTVTKTEAGERPLRLDEFVAACEVLDQEPGPVLGSLITGDGDKLRRRLLERAVEMGQRKVDQLRHEEATAAHELHELYERLAALDDAP